MLFQLGERELVAILGAGRAVAGADGSYDPHEKGLLSAAARALGYAGDVDAIVPCAPDQVAAAVGDPKTRERVVQALILLALMDGQVKDSELGAIRGYAEALGVDEPRLRNLHQLAHGHTRIVYYDLWRRSEYLKGGARKAWQEKGFRGLWQYFGGVTGLAHDAELAWRYKQLGLLPEGTFGREYWKHMVERRFSFPGEHKGFPEELVKHDLCHVLSGYDTDAAGECEVIAFISGFNRADPFGYLFMIFVHMQVGVNVFDGSPVETLAVPPERVVAALERGTRVQKDLYDPAWDFWLDFPRPLAEVRAEYGVA